MNIYNPTKIYPTREAALADGVTEDQLVTGTRVAIERLRSKLLDKTKRKRMRAHGKKR